MSWDPQIYLAFDDHRTRPAIELLARVRHAAPRTIVDLGCGPGNSTALLADRWPDATLTGLDSSPEMLERAQTSGVSADWLEADINTWKAACPPDVIFSNAALQWLDRHDVLFARMVAQLAPGGVLAVQMPRNFDAPSHTLLRDTVTEWCAATGDPSLAALVRHDPVAAPQVYHRMLAPLVARTDIWETTYTQVLSGDDAVLAWTSATALMPFTSALHGTARDDFVGLYRDKLADAYPREPDGTTLFAFKRIFIVAAL
ncbi:methyltransferase domain-containing protein [Pyruvatibacter sp.]|uniref:methyltransferase domain-containing protein n=1 Tax=Pyruvatibacter sp. TaxID=1981328 RepID=UPI0032EEBE5E